MTLELHGAILPIITPFTPSDAVDDDGLATLLDWWISEGVGAVIAAGSAGEFLQLTEDEYRTLITSTVQAVNGRVPVVAGVTADGTRQASERAGFARRAGADAVMVAPPFYTRVPATALARHFTAVAGSADLPTVVYNNPFTTGVDLDPSFLALLAAADERIVAVKDTTFNVQRVIEILELSGGRIAVLAGLLGYESMMVGAIGWVAVPGLLAPRLAAQLCDAASRGDRARAAECHRAILPLMKLEEDTDKYVEIPKAGLAMMGLPGGDPRPPREPLSGDEAARLRRILVNLGLLSPIT
jgi:4-hydroxy-tetrahydrodipicolinate synthase